MAILTLQELFDMPLPQTETPGFLTAELSTRGVRITRQRRTILGIIETATRHLDASQILRKARREEPSVDRVTVYRTPRTTQAPRTG